MATAISAHLYHLRMGPRKVRLVADTIRGAKVAPAEATLSLLPKAAAVPLRKLLQSAVANATHNFGAREEDLVIKSLTVDGGPMLKRSTPKAFGRAAPIRKRSSHVHLVLLSTQGDLTAKKAVLSSPVGAADLALENKGKEENETKKGARSAPQKPIKGAREGFFRKMFQRKAGM